MNDLHREFTQNRMQMIFEGRPAPEESACPCPECVEHFAKLEKLPPKTMEQKIFDISTRMTRDSVPGHMKHIVDQNSGHNKMPNQYLNGGWD